VIWKAFLTLINVNTFKTYHRRRAAHEHASADLAHGQVVGDHLFVDESLRECPVRAGRAVDGVPEVEAVRMGAGQLVQLISEEFRLNLLAI
jgi:hypothetical protein